MYPGKTIQRQVYFNEYHWRQILANGGMNAMNYEMFAIMRDIQFDRIKLTPTAFVYNRNRSSDHKRRRHTIRIPAVIDDFLKINNYKLPGFIDYTREHLMDRLKEIGLYTPVDD